MKLQVKFVLIAIIISFYQVKSERLSPKYEQDGILDESRRQKAKKSLRSFNSYLKTLHVGKKHFWVLIQGEMVCDIK